MVEPEKDPGTGKGVERKTSIEVGVTVETDIKIKIAGTNIVGARKIIVTNNITIMTLIRMAERSKYR